MEECEMMILTDLIGARNLSEDAGAICACVLDSVPGSVHGLRVSLQQRDEGRLRCKLFGYSLVYA